MLWLITDKASHQIISCNLHQDGEKFQVWVERPNGKTLKIFEHPDKQEALIVKTGIDFAIQTGDPVVRI